MSEQSSADQVDLHVAVAEQCAGHGRAVRHRAGRAYLALECPRSGMIASRARSFAYLAISRTFAAVPCGAIGGDVASDRAHLLLLVSHDAVLRWH